MAGAFQFLLNSHYTEFSDLFGAFTRSGTLPNAEWVDWRSRYGGPVAQSDLDLRPTIRRESIATVPPADPSSRTLYRNVLIDEPLAENIITSFEGDLVMDMANAEHPLDGFNAFTLTADYRYQIGNPMQEEIHAKFRFPLPDARLCREIQVAFDGKEIPFLVDNGALLWERALRPGEQAGVSIHYLVSGMDYFVFEIPEPRQIKDFTLRLAINSEASGLITEPEGAVSMEVADQGAGKIVTWRIVNAIAAPRMGTYMTQGWPYSPFHALLVVLPYASRALVFFLALAALTLLIAGERIDLRRLTLLGALFCVPFLVLMSGLPVPASASPQHWDLWQIRMLPLLAVIPVGIGYPALRGVSPLPRLLVLTLMVLFLGAYPLIGSIPDEQERNAILGGVQVGTIFYVFAYTLFTRLRAARRT